MESLGIDKHNGESPKLARRVVLKKKGRRKLAACARTARAAEILKQENHKARELQTCTIVFVHA